MKNILDHVLNWYFSRQALPYWVILIVDCAICYLSGIFVFWLYYHGAVTLGNITILSKTILVYMIFNLIGFRIFHTYSGIIRYSSFVDLQHVASAQALSCLLAIIFHYIIYPWHRVIGFIPLEGRQIIAMYVIAMVLMWGARILVKTLYDVSFSSKAGMHTLIYGVGSQGIGLAKFVRNSKTSAFVLKGFISHDPHYTGHLLLGEKVYKPGKELAEVIADMHIQAVLVNEMRQQLFRNDTRLQNMLLDAGVKIFFSNITDASKPETSGMALHEVKIDDLLPRDEIQIDMTNISATLCGKRVMVTGSAGSIGSELVRQIASFKPAELILIDQAETPQHDVRLMAMREFPNVKTDTYVASIANKGRMESIFRTKRPDYVFHAAAYKHVPMMENNATESVQNNIWGTKVIADLSAKYGVKKVVMISTDKAVNPSNVMGCSKRICEIYCQSLDRWLDNLVIEGVVLGAGHVVVTIHVIECKHPIASWFEPHECELTPTIGARDAFHGQPGECRVIETLTIGSHQHMLHRLEVSCPQHDARDAHRVNLVARREREGISVQLVALVVVLDTVGEVDGIGSVGQHVVTKIDNNPLAQRLDDGLILLHRRHRDFLHLILDVDYLIKVDFHPISLDVEFSLLGRGLDHPWRCVVTGPTLGRTDVGTGGLIEN